MSDIAPEFKTPAAIYKLPVNPENLIVEYNEITCTESKTEESVNGFNCNDVFLKVQSNYLLVPAGQQISSIKFFKRVSKNVFELLPIPKKELLMSPIDSDFVDVHGGDRDSR